MKWLTLPLIKQQLRLKPDYNQEDDILKVYGNSAEDLLLEIINRSYTEVMETYGEVPSPLIEASLLLVSASYTNREPVTTQQLYLVEYSFDTKVTPYMKLTTKNDNGYGRNCNL